MVIRQQQQRHQLRSTMLPACLVAMVALVAFGPEAISAAGYGTQGAWEVVAHGLEAAVLWLPYLWVFAITRSGPGMARWLSVWTARGACSWALLEALMRAACRPAFSMHRPPPVSADLCTAATGWPVSTWSAAAALVLAVCVQLLADAISEGRDRG